jgi:hypothetical protein
MNEENEKINEQMSKSKSHDLFINDTKVLMLKEQISANCHCQSSSILFV